ncbi:MAG: hypothetical protein ABUT20_46010 [Bacteroidota bacterium]
MNILVLYFEFCNYGGPGYCSSGREALTNLAAYNSRFDNRKLA